MKNIAISLALVLLLGACSSGTSVSEVPPTDISGVYNGEFQSSNGFGDGNVTMNIQDNFGALAGNLILEFNLTDPSCIVNTVFDESSARTGFNVQINTSQINFTLTASADGRDLTGTYVPIGDGCSNASGAGTISLSR